MTSVRVEFFGVARARAGCAFIDVDCAEEASLGDLLEALAAALPSLVGPVLVPGAAALAEGSVASLDGGAFTRDPATPLPAGRPVLLLPASSGG